MAMDKDDFIRKYNIFSELAKSKLDWAMLVEIAEDHISKSDEYAEIASNFVNRIMKFDRVHSVRYRIKEPDSLIEKIIRKTNEGETNIKTNTYKTKIKDLIGIRVLYVFKSDYYRIHEQILSEYERKFVEKPQINLRIGDDDKLYNEIRDAEVHNSKIYRSIHYTMLARDGDSLGPRVEIQTRTIYEEAWSEIDHELSYKKKNGNDAFNILLKNSSSILSALTGNCDTLGEMMMQIYKITHNEDESQSIKASLSTAAEEQLRRVVKGIINLD